MSAVPLDRSWSWWVRPDTKVELRMGVYFMLLVVLLAFAYLLYALFKPEQF